MVTIRWDIKTIDRLSMVEDVLKAFSCCDISQLIRHFVQKHAKEFQRRLILDKACFDALHHHAWPGKVRELENTIIRLMLMAESDMITKEDLGMAKAPSDSPAHGA